MEVRETVSEGSCASPCYLRFNINDYVRVRLTDHGRQVHRQSHHDFWTSIGRPVPEYHPPREDESGWSRWQLWQLMEAFGDHIGISLPNCFDLTIEIDESVLSK